MSSSTVVRLANGGSVAVRTGVLRGAGPQGPMGPAGAKGDKGDVGPIGPQPTVTQSRSHLITTASVSTGGDGLYYDLSMPLDTSGTEPNNLLVSNGFDNFGFQFIETGTFFGYLRVRFEQQSGSETSGTSSGSRRVRIVDATSLAIIAEASEAAAPTEPTIVILPVTFPNVDVSRKYKVQAYSDDPGGGVSATNRSLRLFRINAGPRGVQGIQGPVGTTGPQGPAGPAGSAGSGYSTNDLLVGGADSSADPGSTAYITADQAIPYPGPANPPRLPFYFKAMLQFIERRIVAKYSTAAARTTARPSRQVGELTYLDAAGNLQFREKNGIDLDVARVIYSTTTPPTGAGQAAPGVVWIQY